MTSLWFETDLSSRNEIALKFDLVSLESWGLSIRTLNILLRFNFKMTVGDVIRADESFTNIPELGGKGIKELDTRVSQLLTEAQNCLKAHFSIDRPTNSSVGSLQYFLPESVQKLPLDQLYLDSRTYNALVEAKITVTA